MKTVTVTIYIKREATGPKGFVDPYVAEINLEDEDDVEWKLESDYPDASADIEKKRSGDDWPFDPALPPKDIEKFKPKKSGKPKKSAKKENHYNVRCKFKDGKKPIELMIDPDIIIIGGAFES